MEDHVTTKDQLAQWFDDGVAQKADYMIITRDTFEMIDGPVYVTNGAENVHEVAQRYEDDTRMTRVLEVYDLHGDRDVQLEESRTWAIPRPAPSATTALVEKFMEMLTAPPEDPASVKATLLKALIADYPDALRGDLEVLADEMLAADERGESDALN